MTESAANLLSVALDHDDTRSAILRSGVSEAEAGSASYEVLEALSARFLEQNRSVINGCRWSHRRMAQACA